MQKIFLNQLIFSLFLLAFFLFNLVFFNLTNLKSTNQIVNRKDVIETPELGEFFNKYKTNESNG